MKTKTIFLISLIGMFLFFLIGFAIADIISPEIKTNSMSKQVIDLGDKEVLVHTSGWGAVVETRVERLYNYYRDEKGEWIFEYEDVKGLETEDIENGYNYKLKNLTNELVDYKVTITSTQEFIFDARTGINDEGKEFNYSTFYIYSENSKDEWNEFRNHWDWRKPCDESKLRNGLGCATEFNGNSIVLYFSSYGGFDPVTNVTSCRTINESGDYIVNQSIEQISNADCIKVYLNSTTPIHNVNINCLNHDNFLVSGNAISMISLGSNDYLGSSNFSVKNCTMFVSKVTNNGKALEMWGGNNSVFDNLLLTDSSRGLNFDNNNNVTIKNSVANGNDFGIQCNNCMNLTMSNITALVNSNIGIIMGGVSEPVFLDNIVSTGQTENIRFALFDNKTSYVNDSNFSDGEVRFGSAPFDTTIIATNVTYDLANETVSFQMHLIRQWYYDALVNDTNGNLIQGVNINITNSSGDLQVNLLTNSTGNTQRTTLIEYINNEGTRTYYSNFTSIANKSCYPRARNIFNLTIEQNYLDVFTLGSSTFENFRVDCSLNCNFPPLYNLLNLTYFDIGSVTLGNLSFLNRNHQITYSPGCNIIHKINSEVIH